MRGRLAAYLNKDLLEVGCDEAGRGCLAGPVVAAAVILPHNFNHPLLNDSKKLTEKQREILEPLIKEHALAWAVSVVDNEEVDEINVLNASITGMKRAVDKLTVKPDHLLIDGNRFKAHASIPHTCIIKGDGKYRSIAAASILAKTHRDALMREYANEYPGYAWAKNKGYPTKEHKLALLKLGKTPLHRLSFKLFDEKVTIGL